MDPEGSDALNSVALIDCWHEGAAGYRGSTDPEFAQKGKGDPISLCFRLEDKTRSSTPPTTFERGVAYRFFIASASAAPREPCGADGFGLG